MRSTAIAIGLLLCACAKNTRDPYDPSNKPRGEEVPANSANERPAREPDAPTHDAPAQDAPPAASASEPVADAEPKRASDPRDTKRATSVECDQALQRFIALSGFGGLPPETIAAARKQALAQSGGGDPCASLTHEQYVCMMHASSPDQWKACQPAQKSGGKGR